MDKMFFHKRVNNNISLASLTYFEINHLFYYYCLCRFNTMQHIFFFMYFNLYYEICRYAEIGNV